MVKPIRVALLGCGGVARNYRGVYGAIPDCIVDVVVDVSEEEAKQAQSETGALAYSTSPEDAWESKADIVVISTPNEFHLPHAVASLRAGKHVLMQKPIARTAEETAPILAEAKKAGKTVGIYMNSLDHPLFYDVKQMIAGGRFGRIARMRALLAHTGGLGWSGQVWRASKSRTGGGSFIQVAVHYVHLLQWLSGSEFTKVSSISKNLMCNHLEGDDITATLMEMDNGAIAEIGSGWCYSGEEVSVFGERATVQYLNNDTLLVKADEPFIGRVIQYETPGTWQVLTGVTFPRIGEVTNPLEQHRMFVEDIRAGRPPQVTAEEGLRDMSVVDAVHRAAEIDSAIRLERSEVR